MVDIIVMFVLLFMCCVGEVFWQELRMCLRKKFLQEEYLSVHVAWGLILAGPRYVQR